MEPVDRDANAALRQRFDDAFQRYATMRESVSQLQRDLDSVEATIRSPDGMVTVVIGPGGVLKRLELHERAYQEHPPQRLAALITQAARLGTTRVANLVQQRIGTFAPDGSGLDAILRRHDERIGYADGD
ncbi:MAG TPA: YbaB/EbfC family nucleoid-associated protein [Candidatus Limnocylindrales bacterium]